VPTTTPAAMPVDGHKRDQQEADDQHTGLHGSPLSDRHYSPQHRRSLSRSG
jgi:hypothetical protein